MSAEHLIALARTVIQAQQQHATSSTISHASNNLARAAYRIAEDEDLAFAIMARLEELFTNDDTFHAGRRITHECNAIMYAISDLQDAIDDAAERRDYHERRAAYDAALEAMYATLNETP